MRWVNHFKESWILAVRSRIGKNALALFLGQIGISLISLLLIGQMIHSLGVESLGRYLLALAVEGIALMVCDFGLNTYIVRELARDQSHEEKSRLWTAALLIRMCAVLLGACLLILFTTQLLEGDHCRAILIVSFTLLPNGFNALASACIRAYQRMEISSGITLSLRLLTTMLGIVSLRGGGDEIHVLMIYLGVSALGSVFFFFILRHLNLRLLLRHALRIWPMVLRESFPFAISKLSAVLYMRMDMLMLTLWKGDWAAGIYGTSYRLWELMGVVPVSFLDALFPEMSRLRENDNMRKTLLTFYNRSRRIIMLVLPGLVVFSWLVAPFLIRQLFQNPENAGLSAGIFRVLILALPLTSLYLLNGHLLYAIGKQHQVMRALLAAVFINIAGNALLIPRWSYWGAVVATWLSEVFLCIWLGRAARRSIR